MGPRPPLADVIHPSRWSRPRWSAVATAVAVLVVLDVLAGTAANKLRPSSIAPGRERLVTLSPTRALPPGRVTPTDWDTRWQSPAMRSSPWAHAYLQDLQGLPLLDEPYLLLRQQDVRSRYINIAGGARRSWEPPDAAAPVVWLFGGSSLWGEGQRDAHTIPSELARAAAADGLPIRVVNYGQRSFTNYQEFVLFEQQLAVAPTPDLVVFYDGANDISYRIDHPGDQPLVYPTILGPGASPRPDSLARAWARTSAISRATGLGSVTATARPDAATLAREVLDVWGRGLRLARDTSDAVRVPFVSFFQPAFFYARDPVAQRVRAHLPAGVVDLSAALVDPNFQTYIDDVHTNEDGARTIARAMFSRLRPLLVARATRR